MNYIRVCQGKHSFGTLVPENKVNDHITDHNKDWYTSHYFYNEKHKEQFDKSGSVAGITDVVTNKLIFDLDSANDLEKAKSDTLELISRLNKLGVSNNAIQLTFTGNKGYTIVVDTEQTFNPKQLKQLCYTDIGNGLYTLDPTVYNANRIIRVTGTKHEVSGLYKVPIKVEKLQTTNPKIYAKSLDNIKDDFEWDVTPIKFKITEATIKPVAVEPLDFTLDNKPKFLTNCRYALQKGFFKEGERSTALLCLAATYNNLGFEKEHTYRLLKGVAELQAAREKTDRFPEDEIWNNIITQVYGVHWKGGQFSCKDTGSWLHTYCSRLGDKRCKHEEDKNLIIQADEVFNLFKDYTTNYEKNILYSGIHSLDSRMKFMVGTSNAILASPGVGKSSLSLSILNHNSKHNNRCIFFSYDMYHSAVYMRMLQKHTGMSQDAIYKIFQSDPKKINELNELIKNEYKKISFCFKSGQTADEIEDTIRSTEDKYGEKVRMVIVDYNELVATNLSDSTASSAQVAQRLRQIANDRSVAAITLLQPSKMFSSPADEITNYNAAKGSSSIVQSVTTLLGCSRPGFDPMNPQHDKYFNITCLKNRNGPLFSVDLKWEGLRGNFTELEDYERDDLADIRKMRDEKKKNQDGAWN